MKYIQKIHRNISDYGLVTTTAKTFYTLLRPLFSIKTFRIYSANLQKYTGLSFNDANNFLYRILQPNEKDLIDQIETLEEWLQGKTQTYLQNGCICMVCLNQSMVIGFNLIDLSMIDIPLLSYTKKLPPSKAFSHQITIKKSFRGRGIGEFLRKKAIIELKNSGKKYFYGATQLSNKANLHLCKKLGFTFLVDATRISILGFSTLIFKRVHSK